VFVYKVLYISYLRPFFIYSVFCDQNLHCERSEFHFCDDRSKTGCLLQENGKRDGDGNGPAGGLRRRIR
jgi:hypothetical protein